MLNVSHLRKRFSTVLAVDDVSLAVQQGQVLGLLGPNGAGKTTTIRTILNIITPDSGSITFLGRPFDTSISDCIGYLPEERGLYRKSKLINTIVYFATLKGMAPTEARHRAEDWLARFGLTGYRDRRVEELSKGNQQKVQFVISILHDPQLVILDEPFSGLDPINQDLIKDELRALKQREKAIIFSTHQMDHAEKLCDTICLIDGGRVVLDGALSDVKSRYASEAVRIEFKGDGSFLSTMPMVQTAHVYETYAELMLARGVTPQQFLREAVERLEVRKFETTQPSLHAIFLDVVRKPSVSAVPAGDDGTGPRRPVIAGETRRSG
jgi:ABC-2 type transport system ATP-binding protein